LLLLIVIVAIKQIAGDVNLGDDHFSMGNCIRFGGLNNTRVGEPSQELTGRESKAALLTELLRFLVDGLLLRTSE
jgi:hypothetical protein